MVREAKEEIGIDLNQDNLKFVHFSFRPKSDATGDRVDLFFEATQWKGEIINAEPEKCDDLHWIEPSQLPENTTPHVRIAVECIQRGEFFSEIGLDFIKVNYGI